MRSTGYFLVAVAFVLVVFAPFARSQARPFILAAAAVSLVAGCGALWLAQTRGGTR